MRYTALAWIFIAVGLLTWAVIIGPGPHSNPLIGFVLTIAIAFLSVNAVAESSNEFFELYETVWPEKADALLHSGLAAKIVDVLSVLIFLYVAALGVAWFRRMRRRKPITGFVGTATFAPFFPFLVFYIIVLYFLIYDLHLSIYLDPGN